MEILLKIANSVNSMARRETKQVDKQEEQRAHTHNCFRLVSCPMAVDIVPFSWLLDRFLHKRSQRASNCLSVLLQYCHRSVCVAADVRWPRLPAAKASQCLVQRECVGGVHCLR